MPDPAPTSCAFCGRPGAVLRTFTGAAMHVSVPNLPAVQVYGAAVVLPACAACVPDADTPVIAEGG